jgi:hypothetical protein
MDIRKIYDYSLQEVFNFVAGHLLWQQHKSKRRGAGCAYYGENGSRCAVGCLIPEDLYPLVKEGEGVTELCQRINVPCWVTFNKPTRVIELLEELQQLHDHKRPDEWRRCLNAVAWQFGLEEYHECV